MQVLEKILEEIDREVNNAVLSLKISNICEHRLCEVG